MGEFEEHLTSPTRTDTGTNKIAEMVLRSITRDKIVPPIRPDTQKASDTDYLSAAKKHLEAKNFFQAELCLNYAKMQANDPLVIHEILILRAQSARLQKHMKPAQLYLDQALILAPSAQGLLELANLYLATNREKKQKN